MAVAGATAGTGITASGTAGAVEPVVAELAISGGTAGAASPAVFAAAFSSGLSPVAAAVVAGGGEGTPVYSIFSQQPTHVRASNSKQPRDKMTNCWDRLIPVLY